MTSIHHGITKKYARRYLHARGFTLREWGVFKRLARIVCHECKHVFDFSCKQLAARKSPSCRKCTLATGYIRRWEKRTGMRVTAISVNPLRARFECRECGNVRDTEPHGVNPCSFCYEAVVAARVRKSDAARVRERARLLGLRVKSVDPPILRCDTHRKEVALVKKGSRLWGCCPSCYREELSSKLTVVACSRMTTQKYQEKLDRTHEGRIVVDGEYDPTARINLRCMDCGFRWQRNRRCRANGCPNCTQLKREFSWARHEDVTIRSRRFRVQGYEGAALRLLARDFSVRDLEDAQRHKIVISLGYRGNRQLRYYPDLYIRPTNTVVEVKSMATSGLERMKKWTLSALQERARATRRAGFKFRLMVLDSSGAEVKIPRGWIRMSACDVKRYVHGRRNIGRASRR